MIFGNLESVLEMNRLLTKQLKRTFNNHIIIHKSLQDGPRY